MIHVDSEVLEDAREFEGAEIVGRDGGRRIVIVVAHVRSLPMRSPDHRAICPSWRGLQSRWIHE